MKPGFVLLTVIIVLLLAFSIWQYVFMIYEVKFVQEPEEVFAEEGTVFELKAQPLNSFGKKVWFRSVSAEYEVVEGKHLVEKLSENIEEGTVRFKSNLLPGKVIINAKSKFSLFPTQIEVNILSSTV